MSTDYTLVLRSCAEGHREAAAGMVGKLFSLKEHTCQQIVASCPIILLSGLAREEAAAIHLLVHGLQQIGAVIELTSKPVDLHKIDWPRRPQVFKRELSEWVADFQLLVPTVGGHVKLIDLLVNGLDSSRTATSGSLMAVPSAGAPTTSRFRPPSPPPAGAPSTTGRTTRSAGQPVTTSVRASLPPPPVAGGTTEDPMSRLNELFPEEDGGGFMPGREDITNILNRILPDEQGGGAAPDTSGANRKLGSGGFSVFLAKITDEDRRKKAVALIAELGKISTDEAEALSKKMIIPVLRGATKEEAEAAKVQFGKIGILARVKGPE
jgi:hypothetical protein